MFSLLAFAGLQPEKPLTLNTLAATAFLMLLCKPVWLFDVGFQFSFSAVAAIVLVSTYNKKKKQKTCLILPCRKHVWKRISTQNTNYQRHQQSKERIEVDGGENLETGSRLVEAGADVLVAGNAVFSAPDPKEAIRALRNL